MTEEDKRKITSNDYADFLVEYAIEQEEIQVLEGNPMNIINSKYAVIYFPASQRLDRIPIESGYSSIPKLFTVLDTSSLEEMGVLKVQRVPDLDLRGQGVLLGFVDTGIEYNNPIFKNGDNTTRIVSIWDQTVENPQADQDIFFYGTEYTRAQINLALQSAEPFTVVPSTDDLGHGTTLAGLAGGSPLEEQDFAGVAPLTEFIIVKLKEAKYPTRETFLVPNDAICYQENDIMFGIQYLVNTARKLNRPLAICIGLGTNQGGHDGRGILSDMLYELSNQVGISITIAAGNEGGRGHHYFGEINKSIGYNSLELRVGENEPGFTMELWGDIPGIYSIDITSPSGEYIPRIPARIREFRNINFIFDKTILLVNYLISESQTGDQLILMRFQNPAPGIWKFKVYGSEISSSFHIWLPITGFISDTTSFINPNPFTIITSPGNTSLTLTATAYDHRNQSIYPYASRGFNRVNYVKPDLAAPGVNVFSPEKGMTFAAKSGTSIAAALTTGVTAMLLEWGIVRGNSRIIDTIKIQKLLIRGVKRNENLTYPNQEWGYGILDIFETFRSLQGEL